MGLTTWQLNLFPVPEVPPSGPDFTTLTPKVTIQDKSCKLKADIYQINSKATVRCISPIEGI